jgi:hypothetical protein
MMIEPGAVAAPLGALERLKVYFEQNQREVAAIFFAGGFGFDIVTAGTIDSWLTIGQQVLYLLAVTAVLLHIFLAQGAPLPELAHLRAAKRWYYEYRSPVIHFALGALMNLYAIFFFKSSSLLVSFGFLAFLITLLIANESRRFKALGLHVKFALLALCFFAFSAAVVPIIAGSIGLGVFLLSMLAGCLPPAAAAWWIHARRPELFAQARRQILLPAGCVLVGFLLSYLLRVIPPVPLSIPFIGVYHNVERTEESYRLSHERPWWRFWHNGDQRFRAQPGDKVYVFFRIFSPARFADEVQIRWFWKPWRPGGPGWALQDSIPIKIVGGRREGFRGYGVKANYQPGAWKVQVETTDGREIGRIYFDLETVGAVPRFLTTELE